MTIRIPDEALLRPDVNQRTGERVALDEWVDFHRATLLLKCEGLTSEQLKSHSVEPSDLTLLGLVRHMSEVERGWFRRTAAGEDVEFHYCTDDQPDADLLDLDTADAAEDIAHFIEECRLSRSATTKLSLEEVVTRRGSERSWNVRWIYLHMIEEYARHNGHADFLRERIDGVVGD